MNRLPVLLLGATLALGGCRGCEKSAKDPRSYVQRGAESIVEVPKIGALAEKKAELSSLTTGLLTPGQVDALLAELTRVLGFDPTVKEDFAKIGLSPDAAAVGELIGRGRGALWIVPVVDASKFLPAVEKLIRAQTRVEQASKSKIGGVDTTVLTTSFGPESIEVGAYAARDGMGFVALGRGATAALGRALAMRSESSVLHHPEYQALDKVLGPERLARFMVPTATLTAANIANRDDLGTGRAAELAAGLRSVGWGLSFADRALTLDGRLRTTPEFRAKLAKLVTPPSGAPAGVLRSAATDAVVLLHLAGDPKALFELIAAPGSDARAELDRALPRFEAETGVGFETELLPKLSGHVVLGVGVGDLSTVTNLQAVQANPAALFWSASAIGFSGDEGLGLVDRLLDKMGPALERNGLARSERTAGKVPVTVVSAGPVPVLESAKNEGAWVLSNDRAQTDKALSAATPKDPLGGRGGLHLELRVGPLARALEAVDIGRLAGEGASTLMVRAMLTKAITAISRIEHAELSGSATEDGLALRGLIRFAPTAKAQ